MKRILYCIAMMGLLLQPGNWIDPGIVHASARAAITAQTIEGDMPGYAEPPQPIPYNKPGYPSKMGIDTRAQLASSYQPWAEDFNSLSAEQVTQQLSYSADYDPMISGYDLVDWDSLAVITPEGSGQKIRGWKGSPNTSVTDLTAIADEPVNNISPSVSRVGDINNDGIDEYAGYGSGKMIIGNLSEKRFIQGTPAVASAGGGVTWLFARGYDDQLWVLRGAGKWIPLGGTLVSSPTAAYVADGQVDVLALDTQNHIQRCSVLSATITCNGSWEDLGAIPAGQGQFTGEPVMTAETASVQDVFVRSTDNSLWHLAYRSKKWGAWENLNGKPGLNVFNILSSPGAASKGGRIDVVAAWTGESNLHIWRTSDGAPWQWEKIDSGEQFQGSVSVVYTGSGVLDLFALGPSSSKYSVIHTNSLGKDGWSGWTELDASKASAPESAPSAAFVRGTNKVALYYRAHDRGVYARFRDGPDAAWSAAAPLNKQLAKWNIYPINPFGSFALGHFLPLGRMQAIAYHYDESDPINKKLKFCALEFQGGFKPVPICGTKDWEIPMAQEDNPIFWKEKVGDYDGDGVEELSVLMGSANYSRLYVIKLKGSSFVSSSIKVDYGDNANQKMDLVSGHFLSDATADEELGVAFGGYQGDRAWIYLYNVDASLKIARFAYKEISGISDWPINRWWRFASGDVIPEPDGEPKLDEIVYAGVWITDRSFFLDKDDYFVNVRMLRMDGTAVNRVNIDHTYAFPQVPYNADHTYYRLNLAVGDLHRSGKGVIGLLVTKNDDMGDPARRRLATFEYKVENNAEKWTERWWELETGSGRWDEGGELLAGSLTGEGLQLGKPTYRMTPNIGKLIARVNAPPRIVDNGEVKNPGSEVAITISNTTDEALTVEAKASWQVDANIKGTLGDEDGTHVSASLEGSLGQDFGLVSGTTQSVTHEFTISSGDDEQVYAIVGYQLWEYPVIDNAPTFGEEPSRMMAVMPASGANSLKVKTPGVLECDNLFNPGHDINNLLSYAKDENQLPGFKDGGEKLLVGANEYYSGDTKKTTFTLKFDQGQNYTLSKSTQWSLKVTVEGEYDGGIGSVSGSVSGSYDGSDAATEDVRTNNSIVINGTMGMLDTKYSHSILPYFYWDKQGALVLDYVTKPGSNVAWWGQSGPWAKPDLAFIRPWKGHCDTAQGQSQDDISPEITFSDNTPLAEDTVTVTARVHNYSINPVSSVPVRFYLGDPDGGGTEINTCAQTVPSIPARGWEDLTCPFTAGGFGEQRIYVVADPGKSIAERVENNNKAYGLVNVAKSLSAASGADPGLVDQKPGLSLVLNTAGGKQTTFFAPYAVIPNYAVTTFKLEQGRQLAHAFTITALRPDDSGYWTSILQTFGLIQSPQHSVPPVSVSVQYADTDVRPIFFVEGALRLFYWNEIKKVWEDQEPICGKVMRDPDKNVVYAPICKTGTYALMSKAINTRIFLPFTRK